VEVTVWTTVFGRYHRFLPEWLECAERAGPGRILVVSDRPLDVAADVVVAEPQGRFPEAFMRNVACENGDGWLWQVDVDDRIMPDALQVLVGRDCDVVQVGYVSTAGGHRNPTLTSNEQYLANRHNEWMSGSPFTKDMWVRAGGFPDIAWSDWGFWRRCCRAGARVEAAGRPCYVYREEPSDSVTGRYQDSVHVAEALAQ
jgi:hypothetical protein